MEELKLLKLIIINVLDIDVMKKSRQRNFIDARYIYTKILRDRGFTCTAIAKELGKDHTTIVHYSNKMHNLLSREVSLCEKYFLCKNALQQQKPLAEEDVSENVLLLKRENENLISEIKKFSKMYDKYIRLGDILRLIDQRTPRGSEGIVYDKINKMFNGYQIKDLTHYERVTKMGGG